MGDSPVDDLTSAPDATGTPLERYEQRMRRSRTLYYAILAVVVLAFGTVAVVVLSTGELAHTTSRTVSTAPLTVGLGVPTTAQTRAWSTTDRAAAVSPTWDGTVITYSTHSVVGRNARTGARTWSYSRSDRTVCAVLQANGVTIAVYRRDGTCDEITALNSDTGVRDWTRTLDEDGQVVTGTPIFELSNNTFIAYTSSVVYAIGAAANGGVDMWTYDRYGCDIERVAFGADQNGTTQALISQNCTNKVVCTGISFCAKGQQLMLRAGDVGRDDKTKKNFDHIIWNKVGDTGVPVSADSVISAVQPGSNVLDTLSSTTGKQQASLELSPAPTKLDDFAAVGTDPDEFVWIDGRAFAVAPGANKVAWNVAALGPPTAISDDGVTPPRLSEVRLTVPTGTGIATLDPMTGTIQQTFAVTAPPSGSTVTPLGTGFVVASDRGTVVYR